MMGRAGHRRWMLLLTAALAMTVQAGIRDSGGALPDLAPAAGRFLVATPLMKSGYFRESVIFITNHGQAGTIGLIVNRPILLDIAHLVPDVPRYFAALPAYEGGPVQRGVLSLMVREGRNTRNGWLRFVFGSPQSSGLLANLGHGSEPRLFSGYCGWAPGQLQAEIRRGAWHVLPADDELIFDAYPGLLWQRLLRRLQPLAE